MKEDLDLYNAAILRIHMNPFPTFVEFTGEGRIKEVINEQVGETNRGTTYIPQVLMKFFFNQKIYKDMYDNYPFHSLKEAKDAYKLYMNDVKNQKSEVNYIQMPKETL